MRRSSFVFSCTKKALRKHGDKRLRRAVGQTEVGEMRTGIAGQACAFDGFERPIGRFPIRDLTGGLAQSAELIG